MEVVILEDEEQVGALGADIVAQHVRDNPGTVLGLATGSSPLATYRELAARVARGELSLAGCRAFMLDEYVGLPPGHPESYRQVIQRDLVAHVDLDPAHVYSPDGGAEDVAAASADYDLSIAEAGGVDLQLLGVGGDGHIAFNEPGSSLASRTRIKTLTHQTRRDNARFFGRDVSAVPQQCITQGIGTILEARHLVLLATGPAKAEAVHNLVEGPVSAMWPATALQLHPHVTVVLDAAASGRLQLKDYFRETFAVKPDWQGF